MEVVAILFEASPGFGVRGTFVPRRHRGCVAILFEASPGFGDFSFFHLYSDPFCVAILFEASPGFGVTTLIEPNAAKEILSQSSLKRVLVSEGVSRRDGRAVER